MTTTREIELLSQVAILENAVQAERQHADRWQKLAGRYDDIRYALRNCDDTPEGHAQFYNECSQLIFGDG
jgi:hypothetical protein